MYEKITRLDPSFDDLLAKYQNSSAEDWAYDANSDTYTFKDDLSLFIVGGASGQYVLKYGYADLRCLDISEVMEHTKPETSFGSQSKNTQTRKPAHAA